MIINGGETSIPGNITQTQKVMPADDIPTTTSNNKCKAYIHNINDKLFHYSALNHVK